MKIKIISVLFFFFFFVSVFSQSINNNKGISYNDKNPMYWQYNGKPVFLFGGSSNDNLFQNEDLVKELDLIKLLGGNFVRGNMSWRDEGNVKPYLKVNGLYDLNKPNPNYWNKFEKFVTETEKRGIIIMLEIWPTVDFYEKFWNFNPCNPSANLNYTAEESGLPSELDYHHWEKLNPFLIFFPAWEIINRRFLSTYGISCRKLYPLR